MASVAEMVTGNNARKQKKIANENLKMQQEKLSEEKRKQAQLQQESNASLANRRGQGGRSLMGNSNLRNTIG